MIYLYLFLLSLLSACTYRMGGCGPTDLQKEWGWIPGFIRNFKKKRDIGCNLLVLIGMFLIGIRGPWYMWIVSFGLMWGSLSTYHDDMFYNPIKPKDNHWLHGFFIGLSVVALTYEAWLVSLIYALIVGALVGGWELITQRVGFKRSDIWGECGRGFIIVMALGILKLLL